MRRGGACFARLCILKAVGGSETYVNLSDPFRILILKSSPRRDETLKLSQVQCLKASLKRFTHLLLLENITRMSNASSSNLLTWLHFISSGCIVSMSSHVLSCPIDPFFMQLPCAFGLCMAPASKRNREGSAAWCAF